MKCGLLGQKLTHSYSPQIHSSLGDYPYSLFEVEPQNLEEFLLTGNFTGINVTIPYKKSVIPYCSELSPTAKKLGAVNTLVRKECGKLVGHNTDYFGFQSMLHKSGLTVLGKKVLVLGSGGASATVTAVLSEAGANVVVISRSGINNYTNLHLHKDAYIIVNTTPVGMYPNTRISPIDLTLFPNLDGVLDVIYNPAKTQLLLDAEERNLITMNGLWMLVAQAKESAEWFLGKKIPDSVISSIYDSLSKQMQNLILIGMPGSGKSTIGMLLAEKLGHQFVDLDAEIEQKAGMPIPEIFKSFGENAFRTLESSVIAEFGKHSSLIISTGGGCVTRSENYPNLHQNGTIYWIQRDLELLPTDGRPLSQRNSLEEMYRIRKPMYEAFADHIIDNGTSPEEAVRQILTKEVIA